MAKLILIEKPSQEGGQRAFRPICLISALGKLYEQLINCKLRKERSTVNAIQSVGLKAKEANFGQPSKWCILTLKDVKNAFNTAGWDCIVGSLEHRNISPQLVNVIKDYLTDRTLIYGTN